MNKLLALVTFAIILGMGSIEAAAQKKAKLGRVCGDPTAVCKAAKDFQVHDLAFDTGKNFVIASSEPFYGIVLKSKKLSTWGDCEHPTFTESERLSIQELFPTHKVFSMNCVEAGTNYYTAIADNVMFIGVYAGRTLSEANSFLKTVQATGKFPGIRVRKMQVGLNGT